MIDFLKDIGTEINPSLDQVTIGWGSQDKGIIMDMSFDMPSLHALLSAIGFDPPDKDTASKKNHVTISVAYEKINGAAARTGYTSFVKITIAGPVKLSDFIDAEHCPDLPELEKVELFFEGASTDLKNAQGKPATEKDVAIRFIMTLGSSEGQTANSGQTIIEADYIKKTNIKDTSGNTAGTKTTFLAAMYSPDGRGRKIDFEPYVPIQVNIKDLFILKTSFTPANKSQKATTATLFGSDIDLNANIDLSKLPVVGSLLTEATVALESFRIVYSSGALNVKELEDVNKHLIPMGVPAITAQRSNDSTTPQTSKGLEKGFNFHGVIKVGPDGKIIDLFSGSMAKELPATQTQQQSTPAPAPQQATKSATPTKVGKKYGPLTIQSVSMGLQKGFHLDMTGALQVGPLQLGLIGFSMTFPIDRFDPGALKLGLEGLSLDYNKPPLTIAGGFYHKENEYMGELCVGYKEYQLTAFGAFGEETDEATKEKYKSFFMYGFLATPPIGAPFLRLTGMAMGFGYNRTLVLPTPLDIETHPLVSPAMGGSVPDFSTMKTQIGPSKGDFWGAVGVRITSFKLVESFILAVVKFGHELEIDILGRTTITSPPVPPGSTIPPMTKIIIGVVARIIPEQGVIDVKGNILPGSYIKDPFGHVSGGFAVLVLTKDQISSPWAGGKAGDFVLTFGGYGPNYTPKPYYPQNIAPLTFSWKPFHNLDVTAQLYFAIVPEAIMFGGHLSANFSSGGSFNIFVHFDAGVDFIMWWQPKHYLGHAYANLHVGANINVDLGLFSIHKSVEFEIHGDITFWGPPFAGHASLSVNVLVSFTVAVDFGAAHAVPKPISWDEFSHTVLPEAEKVVNVALTNGLLGKIELEEKKETIYLVNPKELALDISSAFPIKTFSGNKLTVTKKRDRFGIAPMAKTETDLRTSELSFSFKKGTNDFDYHEHFDIAINYNNFPASVWNPAIESGKLSPAPDKDHSLMELCSGVTLKAKPPKKDMVGLKVPFNPYDIILMPETKWAEDFTY